MMICSNPECQTTAGCKCNEKQFVRLKGFGVVSDEYLRGFQDGVNAAQKSESKPVADKYLRCPGDPK